MLVVKIFRIFLSGTEGVVLNVWTFLFFVRAGSLLLGLFVSMSCVHDTLSTFPCPCSVPISMLCVLSSSFLLPTFVGGYSWSTLFRVGCIALYFLSLRSFGTFYSRNLSSNSISCSVNILLYSFMNVSLLWCFSCLFT